MIGYTPRQQHITTYQSISTTNPGKTEYLEDNEEGKYNTNICLIKHLINSVVFPQVTAILWKTIYLGITLKVRVILSSLGLDSYPWVRLEG